MGSKPSCLVEDQADSVFKNQVILRELLTMLNTKEIRKFRRINMAVGYMASNVLYLRGNKARKISDGIAMRSFLDTMGKRLGNTLCYTSVNLGVCGIPLTDIQRFCEELGPHIRDLQIDLGKIPYWWYLLKNNGREPEDWNKGKIKTSFLLEAFSNVEQLHLTLADDDGENILTGDDLQRVPESFPKLRVFQCTHLEVYITYLPQLQESTNTFFVIAVTRSPNLEHVILERSDCYLPGNFRRLPHLLSEFPQPPALSMKMTFPLIPPLLQQSSHWQFVVDMAGQGFNRLRTFDCHFYLGDAQTVVALTNFLALQAQSLETLSLRCSYYGGDDTDPWVFPIFPNVTSLKMVFDCWKETAIPAFTCQHFPKLTNLERREYNGISTIFYGDMRIIGTQ